MTELEPFGTKQKIPRKNGRKRKRSQSTSSEEEWFSSDESIHQDKIAEDQEEQQFASGPWTYDLDVVLAKKEFEIKDMCREMNASDFTIEYVQENGVEEPLLFRDSLSSLGMKMPKDGTFTARCVLKAVGDRMIEVVDVMTQGSRQMMLSDFVEYYESPPAERKDLLNLLSLEFSLTPLSKKVRGPALALEIDWVELYWPRNLRNSPSTFPKVQNYCLMSVKRSFTDFHIDFGGTSVWYHVYKGRKIFWIIEPTEENILKYERWILEGSQHEAFFGDLVDKCARIELYEGYTFIIPSGWIHAVYTPEDSLVFGGNFLHSFSIPMQLRVIRSENILVIKEKYRYPSYMEMVWYVIENIVKKATGRIYKIDKTSENVSVSNDQKVDNSALKGEAGANIGIDSIKKEANEDVATYEGNISAEIKENAVDSAVELKSFQHIKSPSKTEENSLTYNDVATSMTFELNDGFFDPKILEYLSTISKKEREGFKSLLFYMREVVNDHKDSANQEKDDLLDIFEQVLNHQVPEHFVVEKEKKKNEQQISPKLNQWLEAFGKNKSPIAKRKVPPKEKVIETQQFTRPKPPKSKVKSNKKPDYHKPDGPLIVGGIPPAIMPADAPQAPNPYGYDPLASVTPLGHKQLPSAYRRTPDMAKAPPSQKFRLQPQLYKVVKAASEKMETIPEKTSDNLWSTNVTSAPGPSNDSKSAEYESRAVTTTHIDNERSFYHSESTRFYRDRNKDNQRENRHIMKEEYPELQYRSPLVRPGPSIRRTNMLTGSRGKRRDSKKNDYSTSWRPETHRKSNSVDMSGIFLQSFALSGSEEMPPVIRHNYSVPGDPRLPSAEDGLLLRLKMMKKAENFLLFSQHELLRHVQKQGFNISMNISPSSCRKMPSPVGLVGSSQYVPLLNRERNSIPSSCDVDITMQNAPGNEHDAVAVVPLLPLPTKCPVSPSGMVSLNSSLLMILNHFRISYIVTSIVTISGSHGSAVVEPVNSAEGIKKPEIRDLSVTLNEGKEDDTEIMTAAEELAELTKVFDVGERDAEEERTKSLMVTVEERKLKRQNWSTKNSETEDDSSPLENVEIESVSLPKLSKIPTETVLQNLSSLTAEFNAVVD
uniref:JmjC domain-containing protein n=3 Tax=Wuchereria bancrofti TaxID=6293 RepID=A0A1I8EH79_WUCBA